jgi:hypothetical protein
LARVNIKTSLNENQEEKQKESCKKSFKKLQKVEKFRRVRTVGKKSKVQIVRWTKLVDGWRVVGFVTEWM